MTVELVYFEGCPQADQARARLRLAFTRVGELATWTEWNTSSGAVPDRCLGHASPTVLVNDVDITGKDRGAAAGCAVDGGV